MLNYISLKPESKREEVVRAGSGASDFIEERVSYFTVAYSTSLSNVCLCLLAVTCRNHVRVRAHLYMYALEELVMDAFPDLRWQVEEGR